MTESPPDVAITISESPDMRALGLSDGHLRDAMAEVALHLLASGKSLTFSGDPRQHGFTQLLSELLIRCRNNPRHRGMIGVTNYLGLTSPYRNEFGRAC